MSSLIINNSCNETNEKEDYENSLRAYNLVNISVPAMVLKTVIQLDILEIIKKAGPGAQLSAVEIAAQLPTKSSETATMLDRLLRLLASYSVVTASLRPDGPNGGSTMVYGFGLLTKFLVKNDDVPSYAGYSLFLHDKVMLQCWDQLKDAVLEGGVPFNKTHGKYIFEYIPNDPRLSKVSANAVSHYAYSDMKKVVDAYKGFEGLLSLVDVGGGNGANLNIIASKYPATKCINYDIPDIINNAPSYPAGIEHVAGDMYVSVPKADAIFMKYVLHITSDEQCVRLLKNCHAALPDHGKVIVCDAVVPELAEDNDVGLMP